MDTYIKMCDCEEIQDQFFNENYLRKLPSYLFDKRLNKVGLFIWLPSKIHETLEQGLNQKMRNEAFISIEQSRDAGIYKEESQQAYSKSAIWLPRQDQLQEMITNFNIYNTTEDFSKWVNIAFRSAVQWESLEQMWLSYVMKKNYNKMWNTEKWEQAK